MKQKCPTYLKNIGKSKALATTLSDTEPEDDFDNEDDKILNAFIATVNPTEGIVENADEEEELVESKFEKMDYQDDIHTAYEKLLENNFLAEKTKMLEVELFQVKAQLERTSSAKFDEMLNLKKSASNRTGLGYDLSSSNIASTSTTIFVPLSNNGIENNDVKTDIASENIDIGKSILGAPPKQDKKEAKNPRG